MVEAAIEQALLGNKVLTRDRSIYPLEKTILAFSPGLIIKILSSDSLPTPKLPSARITSEKSSSG